MSWRGKLVQTGIYKFSVEEPIFLDEEDVQKDTVVDRKHHGGIYKACYLYSADHYDYWKDCYGEAQFAYGMFGENVTVEGLDETQMKVGDVYKIGDAEVMVSEPRQPCFKLGIRFNDQGVLKRMIDSGKCGVYLRIKKPGFIRKGDSLKLLAEAQRAPSISEIFQLLYSRERPSRELFEKVRDSVYLREDLKTHLLGRMG